MEIISERKAVLRYGHAALFGVDEGFTRSVTQGHTQLGSGDVVPVSYTHLDVYKRQYQDLRHLSELQRMLEVASRYPLRVQLIGCR